jgi:hypothetical protein
MLELLAVLLVQTVQLGTAITEEEVGVVLVEHWLQRQQVREGVREVMVVIILWLLGTIVNRCVWVLAMGLQVEVEVGERLAEFTARLRDLLFLEATGELVVLWAVMEVLPYLPLDLRELVVKPST